MGTLHFKTADGENHSLGQAYRGEWTDMRGIWRQWQRNAIELSKMSGKDVFYCIKRFRADGIFYEYRFFNIAIAKEDIKEINRRFHDEYNIEIVYYDRVKDFPGV